MAFFYKLSNIAISHESLERNPLGRKEEGPLNTKHIHLKTLACLVSFIHDFPQTNSKFIGNKLRSKKKYLECTCNESHSISLVVHHLTTTLKYLFSFVSLTFHPNSPLTLRRHMSIFLTLITITVTPQLFSSDVFATFSLVSLSKRHLGSYFTTTF